MHRLASILLGGTLLFAASTATAQPYPPPLAPYAPAPLAPTAGVPWSPGVLPPPPPAHSNRAVMLTGIALTGAGVAMIATGVPLMMQSCPEDFCGGPFSGLILWTVGIPHVISGVSLWIAGAVPPDPRYRSNGARSAGIFLTSLASASLVGGMTAILLDPAGTSSHYDHGLNLGVGVPLASVSGVVAAVGVPLWVIGSKPPRGTASIPDWIVPTFTPGLGSGSFRWTF